MDFAVPADHRVKLKEVEQKHEYLGLSKDLKKLCNIKVADIPIVMGHQRIGKINNKKKELEPEKMSG